MSTFPRAKTLLTFLAIVFLSIANMALAQEEDTKELSLQVTAKQMIDSQTLMGQIIQLAYNKDLQQELSMVPDQVEHLKEISSAYQKRMMERGMETLKMSEKIKELMAEGKSQEAAEYGKKIQKQFMEQTNLLTEQATEALLPHQVERLQQISKQQSLKTQNKFQDEFGIPFAMADDLGLSKDQKKQLEKVTKEARKEFYKEVEKLKEKTKKAIYDELNKEQQEKLEELLGDFYDREKQMRLSEDEDDKDNQ